MKKLFSYRHFDFDISVLVYRVLVATSLFFVHGVKKLSHFDTDVKDFPDPLGFGTTATFLIAFAVTIIGPLMIMAGFLTRLACVGVLALTLSGLLLVHIHDSPDIMDTPYIYSVSSLLIFLLGPGKYSVDAWITQRRQ